MADRLLAIHSNGYIATDFISRIQGKPSDDSGDQKPIRSGSLPGGSSNNQGQGPKFANPPRGIWHRFLMYFGGDPVNLVPERVELYEELDALDATVSRKTGGVLPIVDDIFIRGKKDAE